MEVLSKLKPGSRRGSQPETGSPPTKEDILNTLDSFSVENKENNNNADLLLHSSMSLQGKLDKAVSAHWDGLGSGQSTPASLSHSYSLEWEKLFSRPDTMKYLKSRAVEGELRSSRFRSVVWKLFLEVLPTDKGEWITKTRAGRAKFEELKNKLIVNPRKAVDSVDITLNNPLSQDEESPWNKFFQDNELRLTIKQDVIRTYPRIEFFQSNQLRNLMVNILFIFAKENAELSYRQGMHELLAPLIFVLHCDHQAFLHACEIESVLQQQDYSTEETRSVMKEVMDPAYLEHDAYTMFCQVMETVEPWYLSRDIFFNPKTGSLRNLELLHATPFARSQDLNPSNAIVTKLTRIQDYILKKFDPELHQHLERLEIAPQIYGIRWLRLLFGREFPMQDLLMLWDAIFGDGIGFDLVDYVFVAMLMYIRDILLTNDYATCLTVLMKYPPVADVHYFVVKATWLREPNQHPRPPNYTHQGPIKTSSSMGGSSGSLSTAGNDGDTSVAASASAKKPRENDPIGSTVSLSQVEESMFRNMPSASSLARLDAGSNLRSAQSSPGVHNTGSVFPLTPDDLSVAGSPTKFNTLPNKPRAKQKKLTKLERELQQQVAHLQGEIHDKENMCRYCSSKLDVHIERLQQDLSRSEQHIDSEVMVSLAGLKLVRDILNGTLRFSQNITSDEDLAIVDGYYSTGNQNEEESNLSAVGSGVSNSNKRETTADDSPDSDILLGATASGPGGKKRPESSVIATEQAKLLHMGSGDTTSPEENHAPSVLERQDSAGDGSVRLGGEMGEIASRSMMHGRGGVGREAMKSSTNMYENSNNGTSIRGGHEAGEDSTSSDSNGVVLSKIKSMFTMNTQAASSNSNKQKPTQNHHFHHHQQQQQQQAFANVPSFHQEKSEHSSSSLSSSSVPQEPTQRFSSVETVPASAATKGSGGGNNFGSNRGGEDGALFHSARSKRQGSEKSGERPGDYRELTSLDGTRGRAKSDVTGAASYWPDFLSSNTRLPWYGDAQAPKVGEPRETSRERSRSQPTGRGLEDSTGGGVNPLYKLKYHDSMEH